MTENMFSNSAGLHSPLWAREETWGKSFLAVARGPVTGKKAKATSNSGRPFSYMVPSDDPTSDCEMGLAPDFLSFLPWPAHLVRTWSDNDQIWRSWTQI